MANMSLVENKGHILTTNVIINKKYLENIQKLSIMYGTKVDKFRIKKKIDSKTYEIGSSDLEDLVSALFRKVCLILEIKDEMFKSDLEYGDEYLKETQQLLINYEDYMGDLNSQKDFISELFYECLFETKDFSKIENFLELLSNIVLLTNKISKKRDLIKVKEDVLKDLKYILPKEKIKEIETECQKLFSSLPIDLTKIEKYLKVLQQIILEDWKIKITNPKDFIPGKPFKFICHSTSGTNFKGKFKSKYVSTSLLTEEFTETYRAGFGFVFDASNIVGASSKDMYIDNYTTDSENICNYTSLPQISSVDRIITELRELKCQNETNENRIPVYSEIVKDEFNPIAIFCLTDGSKTLNNNYQCALELQKSFPDLEIVEIDLTLYKSYEELKKLIKPLIFNIEFSITSEFPNYSDSYYEKFEYFFKEYLNLKKDKNYTEQDIINLYLKFKKENKITDNYTENDITDLYLKHKDMLLKPLPEEEVFSGKYTEEEILYILTNNYKYNFQNIFNGDFTSFDLINLKLNLSKTINNPILKRLFPNIDVFLKLLHKIDLDEEIIDKLKENNPINFTNMVLTIRKILEDRKKEIVNQIVSLKEKQQKLETESTLKRKDFESTKQMFLDKQTINNLKIKEELETIEKRILELEKSQKEKEYLLAEIASMKNIINLEIVYELAKLEYDSCQKKIGFIPYKNNDKLSSLKKKKEKLEKEKQILSKHKLINYFKIKKLEEQLKFLERNIKEEEKLQLLQLSKQKTFKIELEAIKESFYEKTKINFLEFPKLLVKAEELYDINQESQLKHDLIQISLEINRLKKTYSKLQDNYKSFEHDDVKSDLHLKEYELKIALSKIQNQLLLINQEIQELSEKGNYLEEVINISK